MGGATDSPPPAATEEFPEAPTEPAKPRRLWPLWTGLIVACASPPDLWRWCSRGRQTGNQRPRLQPYNAAAHRLASRDSCRQRACVYATQTRFRPDLSKLRLKVVDVVLINKSGNEYKGIATVKTPEGEDHDVPVEVTADKDNTLWETLPGVRIRAGRAPSPPKAPNCPASSRTEPCGEFQDLPVGG